MKKIPDEYIDNIKNILQDFHNSKRKNEILKKIHPLDQERILNVYPCLTHVVEKDIEKVRLEPLFIYVYQLLKESKRNGEICDELTEIFETHRFYARNYLYIKRGRIVKNILGNQLDNYNKIKRLNKVKAKLILDNKIKKVKSELKEELILIEQAISLITTDQPSYIQLKNSILDTSFEPGNYLECVAFLILNPKHQITELMYLDESWENFPLKWYLLNTQPTAFLKNIFKQFKEGGDLSGIFVAQYEAQNYSEIFEKIESHYTTPPISDILFKRKEIIKQAITCYDNKLYAPSICTSLTLIEGLLWSFSEEIHNQHGEIYQDDSYKILKLNSGKTTENLSIGTLLDHSKFGDIFDTHFIAYFCEELYKERNPILHGKDITSFTKINASKKIATIEFIINIIHDYNKKNAMERLKKNIDPELRK